MNNYRELEKSIGYRFKRKGHLEDALTHPSHRHENRAVERDNQRLEFLGDAVLDLLLAEHLYRTLDLDEGAMTQLRSNLCCTTTLAKLARSINLGGWMILGRGEAASHGAERDSNLADALEAVIGAAYIDGGMRAALKIFRTLFLPLLVNCSEAESSNPKGALQEFCQKRGQSAPTYRTVSEHGPAHARRFLVEVEVDGRVLAQAEASRKSRAEQQAASKALAMFASERNSQGGSDGT